MQIYDKLGLWYEKEKRELPWRGSTDPYKIWLSEIILQQTRVAQGTSYYLNFLQKYPDIFSLAAASPDEVLKLWQGLGYYSRARNLHETAKRIATEMNGVFPGSYDGLLRLKGVGNYTAAAISSIAYNEPHAAIDGNVKRVISRLFAVEEQPGSPAGSRIIFDLANEILDKKNPGRHNQAMMELGANICLPSKPLCPKCPLNVNCLALKENKVAELPLKYKKANPRIRYFYYLIFRDGDRICLKKRTQGDIWTGLYEFPLIEKDQMDETIDLRKLIPEFLNTDLSNFEIREVSSPVTHKLTHLTIICCFIHITVPGDLDRLLPTYIKLNINEFEDYPIPRLIDRYISKHDF